MLVEEQGQTCKADDDADSDEARVLWPLQAAACTYRIAFGPRAGQKVLTVQGAERGHGTVLADGPVPREEFALASASAACKACPGTPPSSNRCVPTSPATEQHAAVRCATDDRQALEQLCRYITRPAQDRRSRANQRGRASRAQAQDPLARRHHAPGDVAAGVHAAAGCVGDRRGAR